MNELSVVKESDTRLAAPLTANDIIGQVRLIQEVMSAVMRDKEHYGVIPGCGDKPSLLQPGAQKLLLTFRLAPEYIVTQTDSERGHREYRVQCSLRSIGSGNFCGQGVGSCSTMEGKYRFRVAPKKLTDRPVPKEYWDLRGKDPKAAQAILGGPGFSIKKDENGQWMITEGSSEKVEHDNPADYYNTVLKMAKKRALVDATLTATAASDIFTQDIEDMPEAIPGAAEANPAPKAQSAPAPSPQRPSEPAPQPTRTAAPRPSGMADNGDLIADDAVLEDYAEKTGTGSNNKPYTLWVCNFKDKSGAAIKASTFDKKIGETLDVLKGQECRLKYKPGRKEGSFDIVFVEASSNVPF
jgi:hypothetical protein